VRRTVTRDEVLDIAAELFARNGYRATNLRLVAERLDVTRQALYHHFDNKPAILGALFARVLDKLEAAVGEAAQAAAPGESRFAAMLRAHLGVVAENRDLVVVLHREQPEMAKIDGLRSVERSAEYFERFVDAYAEDVEGDKVAPLDPRTAATVTVAAANGLWSYLDARLSPELVVETVYAVLCRGFLHAAPDVVTAPSAGRRA
jgi:AcrR family transcriptional regulator